MISSPGTGLLLLNQFQTLWWAGRPQDDPFPGGAQADAAPSLAPRARPPAQTVLEQGTGCAAASRRALRPLHGDGSRELSFAQFPSRARTPQGAAGGRHSCPEQPTASQSLPPALPSSSASACEPLREGIRAQLAPFPHKLRPNARICDLGTVLHRQLTCHGQAPGAQHSPGGAAGPWVGHARPVTQQKEPPGSSPPRAAPAPSPAWRALTP